MLKCLVMKGPAKDITFMNRALKLAEKARGATSPNPMVGAVIVKNGNIIAEDYHKKPGELHAEALAIQKAGKGADGSTLYVTLEPCCHLDKRTPPCTKTIIGFGIKKVVVAMTDPNPKVAGKGIRELRNAGVEVVEGVLEEKAAKLNEAYIKYIKTGLPFVTLKVAMTLDGKIATPEGQSKWITGEAARKIVHKMRSANDAVLTAIGTVKADNPSFTSRIKCGIDPKRIVIDPDLETPLDYNVCSVPPDTFLVTRTGSGPRPLNLKLVTEKGLKIIEYKGKRVDLGWLMKQLGLTGITSVMIEGGSSLNSYALQDGIVDKVVFFIAPKIIGGKESIPAIGGLSFRRLEDAFRLNDLKVRKVGDDLMVVGYITKNNDSVC